MNLKSITDWQYFRPAMGAALAVLCGLILWGTPIGDAWVNRSYDYQFRFGSRAVTNNVVLIEMDNESYADLGQDRSYSKPWDRTLQTRLLNNLADGGAAMVVMDVFFIRQLDATNDNALAAALRRQKKVVLGAKQAEVVDQKLDPTQLKLDGVQPIRPADIFLEAAHTNWGVAWFSADLDSIVRKHWPFPSPGPSVPAEFFSLPWEAALVAGASLDNDTPRERWLRYYRPDAWERISYVHALNQESPSHFRDKIVFIGNQPEETDPHTKEVDKFSTPFTRWTGDAYGGVDINITAFLNLMNHEWLERLPAWAEAIAVIIAGILLGGGLCRLRPLPALSTAAVVAVVVMLASVSWSHFGNHWFPWLVISAGQIPCALAWAIFMPAFHRVQETITIATITKDKQRTLGKIPKKTPAEELPDAPDYELFDPPFGEGAYGKVWVVRNAIGEWQALKTVYLSKFGNDTDPFDREFNGISRYKPISDKHPGLLRVDFVTKKREGYFYYVMELGDPLRSDWERDPASFRPRDLVSVRAESANKRLPVSECIRIGIALSDALEFLHQQGLTHRDIKPHNIIFVKGQPKLADVGLTAEIRPAEAEHTFVGTPGYMPPPPERPGTVQADIYALGMVLYVMSTGRQPTVFPEIATTLVQNTGPAEFLALNNVILTACEPDTKRRYQSAAEMQRALLQLQKKLAAT